MLSAKNGKYFQRERERDRERDRETERQRDRETERQRDRDRQTDRQTDRQRQTERDRDRERKRLRERDRERQRERAYPMKINLKDSNPVQLNYNSVPRNLYNELKMCIQDLLNKKWIVHSSSSYSSPFVDVTKKCESIRMFCHYRKRNAKTIPDRHTLPRI